MRKQTLSQALKLLDTVLSYIILGKQTPWNKDVELANKLYFQTLYR
ncbi:hypothetical protein [Vibrio sp. EA2]|nr:hypothetical protein [Vibrio sp. EA2]MDV6254277.1 hypothetical protein [Vibrio sp. EA2]